MLNLNVVKMAKVGHWDKLLGWDMGIIEEDVRTGHWNTGTGCKDWTL